MKIRFSYHAEERLKERNIPNPNKRILKAASKSVRRKIREDCKIRGCDTTKYVYLRSDNFVYVLVSTDIGKYKLITAFILK